MNFDIGDLVTRKSYNNDVVFVIDNIINNIEDLKIIKTWITQQYKSDTKFINFIIRKNK